MSLFRVVAPWLLLLSVGLFGRADDVPVEFVKEAKQLHIRIGDRPFASYVFADDKIPRPYFAHIHAPGGKQVTRNHPPIEGKDATDHATLHPGLWLAFGDLSGADFWRNKATVQHIAFGENPKGGANAGSFSVRQRYQDGSRVVCEETCRIGLYVRPRGYLVTWESEFQSDQDIAFGDQEEMGLGVRLATPLAVKQGGRIINSDGKKNEKEVWGQLADWCDYGGEIDGQKIGVVLMPDPRNFRPSWFHARDYGFMTANPFGRKAFTKGEASKIVVKKGETLTLRFGVLFYQDAIDAKEAYRDYLNTVGVKPKE